MQFLRLLFVLFFTFLTIIQAEAQKPNLVFHQLSLREGLSEGTVRTIIEDKKGFMWFGSEDGLNRYDGLKFKIYQVDPADPFSISNSIIKFLFIDSKNHFWVATRDGLNLYDPVQEKFYNYRSKNIPALQTLKADIETITEDEGGNIWITAGTDGLFKISSLEKPAENYKPDFIPTIQSFVSVTCQDAHTLLIGSKDGLFKFNTDSKIFTDIRHEYGSGFEVKKIYIAPDKNIYLCTSAGLRIIETDGSIKIHESDPSNPNTLNGNDVISILPYKDGSYLLALDGGGIDYFDPERDLFYHYTDENECQLSSNNVTAIFLDSKGDLWTGTFLNGINFSNSTTNLFAFVKNDPVSESGIKKGIVTSFLKDSRGNLWIGTDGGGIYKKVSGEPHIRNYSMDTEGHGLSSNAVITIREDREGNIWVSTYGGGLCRYLPAEDYFESYRHAPADPASLTDDKINDICIYKDSIWLSTYGNGLSIFDKKQGTFRNLRYDQYYSSGIPSDWVSKLYTDSRGVLWLGTFQGLSKYIPSSNKFKNYHFDKPADLKGIMNYIVDIYEDSFHKLWLATGGGGLILFDPDKETYQNYTTKNGLSSNYIKAIIEDRYNNLWLATHNGVTRFDIVRKKGKPYTFRDGIPPSGFYFRSKYRDDEGKIYFGTNNGYLIIDPRMTTQNNTVPPVVITELKIFNEFVNPRSPSSPLKQSISETSELVLNYNQSSLTFEFAALNFNNPQNNQYAYYMDGFDREWVMSGRNRIATYTNLPPGTYTFKVRAANNDNIWNTKGTELTIIITPPFYKSWWFTLIAIVSIILILYLIYVYRVRRIRVKNKVLEETVKLRTREIKEANEQLETFVYKASHDIKGPLKSIIGLTTIAKQDVNDPNALSYFEHILKSTQKLETLLMDLLMITKVKEATIQPEKIDFEAMVKDVLAQFENLPNYSKMKFSLNIQEDADFYSDKKLLFSIIQNLVENPIKYLDPLKEEHKLAINIHLVPREARLTFEDNGVGIPPEYKEKIFEMFFKINESSNGTGLGLYIVKTTVEKLNGKIEVESTPGKGTIFKVFLKNNPPGKSKNDVPAPVVVNRKQDHEKA